LSVIFSENHFSGSRSDGWNASCFPFVAELRNGREKIMKIYLLMLLIGTILTAIRFTSAPEQRSKSLPQ
jgi:hypothetical protein